MGDVEQRLTQRRIFTKLYKSSGRVMPFPSFLSFRSFIIFTSVSGSLLPPAIAVGGCFEPSFEKRTNPQLCIGMQIIELYI